MDLSSYWMLPPSGNGPGVLVLHAWWGLTPFFRAFCDRLAAEGYVAMAPDLYDGKTAGTVAEAEKLRGKLKRETAEGKINAAVEEMRANPAVNHESIAVVGFSLGGWYALGLACQPASPVGAAVLFYASRGVGCTDKPFACQFHLAEVDPYVSASGVKKMQKAFAAAGRQAEFYTYPGTRHWFFEEDQVTAYDANAARLAWERTVDFLHAHLQSRG